MNFSSWYKKLGRVQIDVNPTFASHMLFYLLPWGPGIPPYGYLDATLAVLIDILKCKAKV